MSHLEDQPFVRQVGPAHFDPLHPRAALVLLHRSRSRQCKTLQSWLQRLLPFSAMKIHSAALNFGTVAESRLHKADREEL